MEAISSIALKGIVGSEVATKYLVSMRIPIFHYNLYFVISNLFGISSGHHAISKEICAFQIVSSRRSAQPNLKLKQNSPPRQPWNSRPIVTETLSRNEKFNAW
jgi:hypothetical protein